MGGKIIKSEEALAILRSSNLTALVEYPGSRVPWKAKCNLCEQIVSPRLHNLRNGHKGCIYCSERKMDPSRAIDKMLAAGLQPLEEYLSSKKPWKCRCLTCGEIVFPQYAMIRRGQGGCKFCANIKRGNSNKLTSEFAVSLMLTSNLQPLSEYVSSDKKWKCRCLICGLIVYPTLHSIRNGQGGCKNCGRKKSSDKNRLTHEQAILVLEKSGYTPLEPYKSAISKWKCLHKQCGTIVEVRYSQINFGAGGCKKCGYLNSAEKNRIPEKEAINLMLDAGLQPLEAYKSSTSKWKCLHIACGKIVQPQLADIKQGRGGCRFCGKAGLNYNEPAQLYLMTNQYYGSIKIGVTNISSVTKRISAHKKEGWSVFRVKQFESGDAAYNVEQSVLKWLRMDLKLPYHLAPEQMPQRGWTETVDADEIEVTTIWNKVIEISRNLAYREIERS